MRKAVILVAVVMIAAGGWGLNRPIINREDLSLKAGPTGPGEKLSLVWVEAYVYPKVVKEERVVSLGVRTASGVDSVQASFDFGKDAVDLTSFNGMQWGGAYQIPEGVGPGLHVVRYAIAGHKGSIQRTVEFFLDEPVRLAGRDGMLFGEGVVDYQGWPLTVVSTCTALVDGTSCVLNAGEKVTGISKVPWYKVVFDNGEEGWIPASKVKEPLDEFFAQGFEAYGAGNYEQAVRYYKNTLTIDPDFAKAYFWLAKCYYRMGDFDASYRAVKEAMRLDERDIESKVFADTLAGEYYRIAHGRFRQRRYHEAVSAYQKVLELKPTSVPSWVEIGKSYAKLGFESEASEAWREALKFDPNNREIHALLKIKVRAVPEFAAAPKKKAITVAVPEPAQKLPAFVEDESLQITRAGKTRKGTRIEAALRSVMTLARSLGTPLVEKGWRAKKQGESYLVSYVCEQGQGAIEAFEWMVDIDTKRVTAHNDNARVLMNRW